MAMVSVPVKELHVDIFKLMEEGTPLLTAGNREGVNTMTVSWGSLGTLWAVPACTVYVRPQRYTHQFMDANDYYTLSFFGPEYKAQMSLCGSKSGRDIDKIKECGFTLAFTEEEAPYFEEAEMVLVCKKMSSQNFDPAGVQEQRIHDKYTAGDFPTMYMGEVVTVLKKA